MLSNGRFLTSRLRFPNAITCTKTTAGLAHEIGCPSWSQTLVEKSRSRAITSAHLPNSIIIGLSKDRRQTRTLHVQGPSLQRPRIRPSGEHQFTQDRSISESDKTISAIPGPLDLSIPTISQLQDESDATTLETFVKDAAASARRLLSVFRIAAKNSNSLFINQLEHVLETPQMLASILEVEPPETRTELADFLFRELLLQHPKSFCQAISSLRPRGLDADVRLMRNAASHHVVRYLYFHFLHSGLASASIAEEFYEYLTGLIQTQSQEWTHQMLSILPMYVLRLRCPSAYRQTLELAYSQQSQEDHFEVQLSRIQHLALQGDFAFAIEMLQVLLGIPFVQCTVEYFNTLSVVLQHGAKNAREAPWILSELSLPRLCKDKHLCSLLLHFAQSLRLTNGVRQITRQVMDRRRPSAGLISQIFKTMKTLQMYDDLSDPIFTSETDQILEEKSYALLSSLRRFRLLRKAEGCTGIYDDLLLQLQEHANTAMLVELGIADTVKFPYKMPLDAPLLGMMIWQYFEDQQYRDSVVMPVFNKFKALLQEDSDMIRMALFPDGYVFNVFIAVFGLMSKEHLNDALDMLAELTNNHDPINNVPEDLPEAMRNPARLHAGPSGRTYALLVYGLVRHGQYQAAERCLAEIWKKWPLCWNKPCDALIRAYIKLGRNNKAHWLLKRKINAGFEVTDETIRALSATRPNFKTARKDYHWRKFELADSEEGELQLASGDLKDEERRIDDYDGMDEEEDEEFDDDFSR